MLSIIKDLKLDIKLGGLKTACLHIKCKLKGNVDKYKKAVEELYKTKNSAELEPYLQQWYKKNMRGGGYKLNLKTPKTFNDKLNWLKLYDCTPIKTKLVDKYAVRDYIKDKIGEEYLIPLLGVWDKFDDIDFEKLPNQFVLKANHGSATNVIVKDKNNFNKQEAKVKFDKWLTENYGFKNGFELQYRDVPPKIIAEKYMADLEGDIYDYRFFCFNGEPKYLWLDVKSGTPNHERAIYDLKWNLQDYTVGWKPISKKVEEPENWTKMFEIAKTLSAGFAFVRVDLYNLNGKIYFGELTFTPQSGMCKFSKQEADVHYGELITLPAKTILSKQK